MENSHLGGEGDRRVLEEALAWSDCALLGGNTLRTHRTTCLIRSSDLIKQRLSEGRSEQPIALVASHWRANHLDFAFFRQPLERWLVRPPQSAKSPSQIVSVPEGFHNELPFSGTWMSTLETLASKGILRVALLGGAHLAASFLKEDLIDELQLTFSPKLLGGDHAWIPLDGVEIPSDLSRQDSWTLHSNKLLGGGELLLKYLRNRKDKSSKTTLID